MVLFTMFTSALAQVPPPPPPPPADVPVVEVEVTPPIAPTPGVRNLTRFLSGEEVVFAEASRDAFGMGQDVSVQAPIDDNGFLMGQSVHITSPVGGDLFAMGQEVTIDAAVAGDVYAMGQEVTVTPQGSVGGDLLGAAEVMDVGGPVGGDVQIGAGTLIIGAPVAGLVEAEVGELEIREGASIGGDLTYSAASEATGLEGVVQGRTEFTLDEDHEIGHGDDMSWDYRPSPIAAAAMWAGWTTWSYVAKLVLGFAFLAVGGAAAARVGKALADEPGQSLGWGFVVCSVLVVSSLMTIPLIVGFFGFAFFFILLYGAQVISAQALGDAVLARLRPGAVGSPYISMAVGLLPLVLIGSIPWLGWLVWFGATVAGIGALWVASRNRAEVA